jgi:hypothetical protein
VVFLQTAEQTGGELFQTHSARGPPMRVSAASTTAATCSRKDALRVGAGSLLALLRNILWLAMTLEFAPAYANAKEDGQAMLTTVGDTLIALGFIAGDLMGGILVAGIAVALFSVGILRTRYAPRWVAWLGLAIALTAGWLPLLTPFADVFAIVAFVGFAGFWVWMTALGVVLWRSPGPEALTSSNLAF